MVFIDALRNAALPIITLARSSSDNCCPERSDRTVFSIPGFGKLVVDAVFNRDYAVVQGAVLCTALVFLLLNLLADLAMPCNPRLRAQ